MTTTPLGAVFFKRHFPSRIKQHIRMLGHSADDLADVIVVVRDEFVCNAYHLEDFVIDANSSHDAIEERAVDHIWVDLLPVISKAISDELKYQRKADTSVKRKEENKDKKRLREEEREPKQLSMPRLTTFFGATMVDGHASRVVDVVVDNSTFVNDDDLKLPPITKLLATTTTQNEAI